MINTCTINYIYIYIYIYIKDDAEVKDYKKSVKHFNASIGNTSEDGGKNKKRLRKKTPEIKATMNSYLTNNNV